MQFGGVTCVPGSCDVEAKSRTDAGNPGTERKSPALPHRGTQKVGDDARKAAAVQRMFERLRWKYGGEGFPRLVVEDAEKPPRRGQQASLEEVVQRSVKRLKLPKPVIRTSPDEDRAQVVHVPTWMWVEHSSWEPVSASAGVEGVRVTATARPRKAVWSMGEGGQVTCRGPGTPYSARYSPKASSPDCGYTYRRSSLLSKGGAYTVSVRVTWDVEWQGGGEAGVVPGLSITAQRQLVVDEVQTVVTR